MATSEAPRKRSPKIERPTSAPAERELTYIDYFGLIGTDLGSLLAIVWQRRIVVLATIAIAVLIGLYVAIFSPPLYRAEIVTSPVIQNPAANLGGLINGRFGALSPLVGVNGNDVANQLAVELQTRALIYPFIERFGLQRALFPGLWDAATQSWKLVQPGFIGGTASRLIRYLNGTPPPAPQYGPTLQDTMNQLARRMIVVQDQNANLIRVSFDWYDAEQAATWANGLIGMLNEQKRKTAVDSAQTRLRFLNGELQTNTSLEMRQSLYRLIESETQSIMVANSDPQFALRVLDPAVPSNARVWPRRGLIVALSVVIGLLVGAALSLLISQRRRLTSAR